jgi:hypothetical protein
MLQAWQHHLPLLKANPLTPAAASHTFLQLLLNGLELPAAQDSAQNTTQNSAGPAGGMQAQQALAAAAAAAAACRLCLRPVQATGAALGQVQAQAGPSKMERCSAHHIRLACCVLYLLHLPLEQPWTSC